MAFAQVATTNFSGESANTTTHDVLTPSGNVSGDLLICILGLDSVEPVLSMPAGWVKLFEETGSGGSTLSFWYKILTSTESDFTYTTAGAETTANACLRITGWHGTTVPEGSSTSGNSTNANPPSHTVSGWTGSAEDTLWLACYAIDGNNQATGYPTSFTGDNFTDYSGHAAGPAIAYCTREISADTQDPGTFTNAAEQWAAGTIAIRPAAAVGGRIMSSLVAAGGLAGVGGIAGSGGGLAA